MEVEQEGFDMKEPGETCGKAGSKSPDNPILHDAPPGGDPGRCRTTRGFDRGFRQAGWPHREEEETPIKKHPLHRRVKRVHIVNLEPSRPAADRRTLDGSNTVTLAPWAGLEPAT